MSVIQIGALALNGLMAVLVAAALVVVLALVLIVKFTPGDDL